jgi:hypothetical protein
VAESELDLLERRLAAAGELGEGAAQVVGRQVPAQRTGVGGDYVGDGVGRHSPRSDLPVDTSFVDQPPALPKPAQHLNTHTPGSLYEAFAPTEAKRLADKLEIHHTPKHASWLDMAEIELSVLTSQCLTDVSPTKRP